MSSVYYFVIYKWFVSSNVWFIRVIFNVNQSLFLESCMVGFSFLVGHLDYVATRR
jgi:hypothetical protein